MLNRSISGWLFVGLLVGCEAGGGAGDGGLDDASPEVRAAVERCGVNDRESLVDCYEQVFLTALRDEGVRPALDLLEATAAADERVERDAHVFLHGIGITAYELNPNVSEVFPQCREIFQSGCYHGVIQAHFMAVDQVDGAVINELCQPYKSAGANRWILFQCLHGLGHGLTIFHAFDLPMALEGCDLLTEGWDRQSCYGGVFMENIVNATNPHHPASEMASAQPPEGGGGEAASDDAGEDEHAEHGAAGAAEEQHAEAGAAMEAEHAMSDWKALDPDDPHYPCSALDRRYHRECYMMQTSAMLWMNGGNIGAAAASCLDAPEHVRHICFQSLGRDVSSYTLQDPEDSMRECGQADEEYRAWCYIGLVKNFIDLNASTDDAFEFCRMVESQEHKMKCYEAIGEEAAVLENDLEGRAAICVKAESDEMNTACLYGARVIRQKPEGL